jgi:NAD(P)H dehydrogenase (quinone)
MRNPLPRMSMPDGFNEEWIDFEGGSSVEAVEGTTAFELVIRGLLARDRER